MNESIKYDEYGGIVNVNECVKPLSDKVDKPRSGYNFFEKLLLKYSRKVNYLLDKDGRYTSRKEKIPPVVRLGPTNRCTAQCAYCPREFIHAGGTGYMDFDLYKKIVDWAREKNIKTIGFAYFGEPLIHPRIIDMIDYGKKAGLNMRLSTNGIALNQSMAEKILDYELDAIEISMDGYNEQEYFNGKKVDKYKLAKANVLNLLDKAKAKKVKTVFNIHFVDAGNVSFFNKLRFIKFWREKLNGLRSATTFYYEPHNWAGTRNYIREQMSFVDRLLSKWELKKPCVYLQGLNINWNGDVYVCGSDPTPTAIIGNILDKSFEEIYNSDRRMNYLSEHENGTFKNLNCQVCTVNSIFPLLFIKKRLINSLVVIFGKIF